MGVLSAEQVYAAARAAGASQQEAITLTAIARGESGWSTTAHNPNPPDDSYGLWQINMLGSMGAARRQQFGIDSNDALYDPHANAAAALAICARCSVAEACANGAIERREMHGIWGGLTPERINRIADDRARMVRTSTQQGNRA